MKQLIRSTIPVLLATLALVGTFMVNPSPKADAAPTPFDELLGSWRGGGTSRTSEGTVRLICNAYYTGGGPKLGLAIRCKAPNSKVEIRSKLSLSGSRITGNWEERTYNASGSASGTANPGRINIRVAGSVNGSMAVRYSKDSQSVAISISGSPLQAVSLNLTRS